MILWTTFSDDEVEALCLFHLALLPKEIASKWRIHIFKAAVVSLAVRGSIFKPTHGNGQSMTLTTAYLHTALPIEWPVL